MTDRDSNKPLDALTVKRYKAGTLADAAPHRELRLIANKTDPKPGLTDTETLRKNATD